MLVFKGECISWHPDCWCILKKSKSLALGSFLIGALFATEGRQSWISAVWQMYRCNALWRDTIAEWKHFSSFQSSDLKKSINRFVDLMLKV